MSGPGRQLSYGTLAARTESLARALEPKGIGLGGAPVAFLAEPGPDHLATLLGILRAGGLAVPLSPLHTRPELAYQVSNAAPIGLLASPALRATLIDAAGGRPVSSLGELGERGGALPPVPRALRLLPALPRNAMGKVQKQQLLGEPR
jgi:acyl-CoA synthetase (AMP-forming)/AMP-acid ligase II